MVVGGLQYRVWLGQNEIKSIAAFFSCPIDNSQRGPNSFLLELSKDRYIGSIDR
jgi:hypothetical protein